MTICQKKTDVKNCIVAVMESDKDQKGLAIGKRIL